jgi:hypothetical protein
MEKVKKMLPSVQSAMSLTDMEILHIRQAGGELAEVIRKADRTMAMDFLLRLCEISRIKSWGTSYFRQYKQLYASATGRYMDRNDSREVLKVRVWESVYRRSC